MDRCPLKKIESKLRANGISNNIEAIYKNIVKKSTSHEAARKSNFPVDELYEHVYAK